ncbi:MAG: hypothetical protein JSS57_27055 [Proteobacteria bacterium]|nr:hypothetical protein [Pseudomonadota bacterium]
MSVKTLSAVMHPFVLTASEQELWFIAGLDYTQDQEKHFQALKELIFQRNGTFLPTNTWFPYEVIELGANSAQVGHEREFAICSLLVIHGVASGFDTWTELEQKFSNASFTENMLPELTEILLEQYANAAC